MALRGPTATGAAAVGGLTAILAQGEGRPPLSTAPATTFPPMASQGRACGAGAATHPQLQPDMGLAAQVLLQPVRGAAPTPPAHGRLLGLCSTAQQRLLLPLLLPPSSRCSPRPQCNPACRSHCSTKAHKPQLSPSHQHTQHHPLLPKQPQAQLPSSLWWEYFSRWCTRCRPKRPHPQKVGLPLLLHSHSRQHSLHSSSPHRRLSNHPTLLRCQLSITSRHHMQQLPLQLPPCSCSRAQARYGRMYNTQSPCTTEGGRNRTVHSWDGNRHKRLCHSSLSQE